MRPGHSQPFPGAYIVSGPDITGSELTEMQVINFAAQKGFTG